LKIETIYTEDAPEPVGPYAQAKRVGDFVFCSGQIPLDPQLGKLVTGDIESEATQVIENLKAVLEKAGASLETAVKVTIYLTDLKDFEKVNTIYKDYFTTKPARSTVQVAALPKGARVEMDVVAVRK
jgi:2-iminobutanoate/2-iminopropanoate deaminase